MTLAWEPNCICISFLTANLLKSHDYHPILFNCSPITATLYKDPAQLLSTGMFSIARRFCNQPLQNFAFENETSKTCPLQGYSWTADLYIQEWAASR